MTSFVTPQRTEAPHAHVTISALDIPNLKAQGVDTRSKGVFAIDLSVTVAGQTIVWPRIGEEWYLSKTNDIWMLDKKGGFGNEGFTKEAAPGDIVTVTDGNHLIESNSAAITTTQGTIISGGATINGGSTIDSVEIGGGTNIDSTGISTNFLNCQGAYFYNNVVIANNDNLLCGSVTCVLGATINGTLSVDQVNAGGLYASHTDTNAIYSSGGGNFQGSVFANYFQSATDIIAGGNIQGNTMHCINTLTTGAVNAYGAMSVYAGFYCSGVLSAPNASIGAVGIGSGVNAGGWPITTGTTVMDVNGFGGGHFIAGASSMDGSGVFGNQVNGLGAAFGGVGIGSGGIDTGGRIVNAEFAWMYAGGFFTNTSERRTKRDITPITESHLAGVRAAPLYHYRYDPEVITIPEGSEDHIDNWRAGPMSDDLPDRCVGDSPQGRAPELVQMVVYAWGSIQELADKVDAQAEIIKTLTARLDKLEERG